MLQARSRKVHISPPLSLKYAQTIPTVAAPAERPAETSSTVASPAPPPWDAIATTPAEARPRRNRRTMVRRAIVPVRISGKKRAQAARRAARDSESEEDEEEDEEVEEVEEVEEDRRREDIGTA